jgi:hypothetical protein
MTKQASRKQKQKAGRSPSQVAPRGAMQNGRSPEPENKHAKRTASKQRLTKRAVDDR